MTLPITPLPAAECPPLPDAGLGALATPNGNLPLEGLDVTARITGLTAGVEIVQSFRNPFDVRLEATYVFPLPDRAAVTAFRMEADGHVIDGVLKERGQARADYDRALSEGKRAAIAEEDRPDVFTIRVGNIAPGERVTARLTLSQPLPYEDGAATFRFPLVVAPRYIPGAPLPGVPAGHGTSPDTDTTPDASRITPPVLLPGFPNPVRLSLAAEVDPAGLGLREIHSSLHTVSRLSQDGREIVRVQPGERLDRDFVLRLRFDTSSSLALVPDDMPGQGGTFALTVLPPDGQAGSAPKDVVLLLDRSGSMTGWKMVAARRAAARIVDTLISGDRFAVLAFDSVVERPADLGNAMTPATDRNRYRAVEYLARLEARGGTELLRPLEEAIGLLGEATGRDRVLVLVTDGQVGNEDQILERAGARLGGVRVHTVGIDRAVNAGFLGRLAALGSGRCELVESEDRLDEAMEHIHRRISAPLVTDLTLKAEGLDLIPDTITHLGSLFPGVPLTVSGRFRGDPGGSLTVHGTGWDGRPWERHVTGAVTGVDGGGARASGVAVRAVWARARLRDLEDRYVIGGRGLEQLIVETSLRFGVLCRFTAFVAVDTRVTGEGEPEHRVIQPVELPSGWDPGPAATPLPGVAPMAFTASAEAALPLSRPRLGFAARLSAPTVPAPFTTGGPAARAAFDADARAIAADELVRLRAAETLGARERFDHLADLGSRLRVLARTAGDHPDLTALAAELVAIRPGADIDRLWRHTVEVLTRVSSAAPPAGDRRRQGSGRAFWKRS